MGYFLPSARPDIQDPAAVFWQLVKDQPEFHHIGEAEARIEFLMRTHPEIKAGRQVLGTVFTPDVQGRLRDVFAWLLDGLFGDTDGNPITFLIIIDAEYWLDASEREREILIYHEACHIQITFDRNGAQRFDRDTGLPVLGLVGHDVEEFAAVVARYGAHSDDLRRFVAAVKPG